MNTPDHGEQLSSQFDAIVGHHSHIPQPITEITVDRPDGPSNLLVAYGLGDFCIYEKLKHYHYGQVITLTIGSNDDGVWKAGSLDWRYVRCRPKSDDVWETDITSCFPYLTH